MTDAPQIAENIEGQDGGDANEMNINQELVSSISQRIKEVLPGLPQMAQFEGLMQKSPDLAKAIASICPEIIMAFVSVAQEMQQGSTAQQGPNGQPAAVAQGGPVPAGGNDGASLPQQPPPQTPPPGGPDQSGGMVPPAMESQQSGSLPPPAPTTTGNPPPSVPGSNSPLRRQFYTGR